MVYDKINYWLLNEKFESYKNINFNLKSCCLLIFWDYMYYIYDVLLVLWCEYKDRCYL